MKLDEMKAHIPDYAKDLRLNLDSVLSESGAPGLSAKQIAMVALASAVAARHIPLTQAIGEHAASVLSADEVRATHAAAAIMSMNNIYYRFAHLVSDPEYQKLPARLRMNVMANPGCEKIDFELCSLAVSAINGCGACVDSHEKVLREHGLSVQTVQSAVRIAAVLHAVGVVLEQQAVA